MESIKQDVTKLYSITEYAKLFNISRQTVYNWMADKEKGLTVITISGKQFIQLSA